MSLLTKCASNSGGGLFNPVSLISNEGIQVKMSDAISPAEEILTELDIHENKKYIFFLLVSKV